MKRNLQLSWVRTPGGLEMKWTVETPTARVETPPRGNPLGATPRDRPKRLAGIQGAASLDEWSSLSRERRKKRL